MKANRFIASAIDSIVNSSIYRFSNTSPDQQVICALFVLKSMPIDPASLHCFVCSNLSASFVCSSGSLPFHNQATVIDNIQHIPISVFRICFSLTRTLSLP